MYVFTNLIALNDNEKNLQCKVTWHSCLSGIDILTYNKPNFQVKPYPQLMDILSHIFSFYHIIYMLAKMTIIGVAFRVMS